jgi:hypothetical protein
MSDFIAVLVHIAQQLVVGWLALRHLPDRWNRAEFGLFALLVGMVLETMFLAMPILMGWSLRSACLLMWLSMLPLVVLSVRHKRPSLIFGAKGNLRAALAGVRWYEWLLAASLAEKLVFIQWNIVTTRILYWDALAQWGGRARVLHSGVNWSTDPDSPAFLGYIGFKSYPLLTHIWKAVTATIGGGWSDAIGRADGPVFYLALAVLTWLTVNRFSGSRPLATTATFLITAMPLMSWSAMAGQADIGVVCFSVGAVSALLGRSWLLAGLMLAGAGWVKNDGFYLFYPGFLAAVLIMNRTTDSARIRTHLVSFEWKNVIAFCLGAALLVPWELYKIVQAVSLPEGIRVAGGLREGAFRLLSEAVVRPTHQNFWIFAIASLCLTFSALIRRVEGQALLVMLLIIAASITFVFTSTPAFRFLWNGLTIHRVLLQFSGVVVITIAYGVSLACSPSASPIASGSSSSIRDSRLGASQ